MSTRLLHIAVLMPLLFLVIACGGPAVPGGEITVTNDILDKEYNSFRVHNLVCDKGASALQAVLKPGQQVLG